MDAIRRAALDVLLTTGPDHVTIRDIADQADVAHVYIPQYFGGKAELFADIYPIATAEAAGAFTWPETTAAGIRPELLRVARLALWLSANHPDGIPDGPRPLATRVAAYITESFQLDDQMAKLVTERLMALVVVFAAAPLVVSREPIDLAAHIELELRMLAALASSADAT